MAYQTVSLEDFKNSQAGSYDPVFLHVVDELPALTKKGPWLAGGSVRKFMDLTTNEADYDIFFADAEQYTAWVAELLGRGANLVSTTNLNSTYDYQGWKIQCISFEYHKTLIQHLNRFDMAHCQFGFDGNSLVWSDLGREAVKNKELIFLNLDDPVYLLNRAMKFASEGYKPKRGEIARVLKGTAKNPGKIKAAARGGMSGTTAVATVKLDTSSFVTSIIAAGNAAINP